MPKKNLIELLGKIKDKIDKESFASLKEFHIQENSSDAKQIIYTLEESGKYRLEISPEDKTWVIVKDKNYPTNKAVLENAASQKSATKTSIALSLISLFIVGYGVWLQYQSTNDKELAAIKIELQKQSSNLSKLESALNNLTLSIQKINLSKDTVK